MKKSLNDIREQADRLIKIDNQKPWFKNYGKRHRKILDAGIAARQARCLSMFYPIRDEKREVFTLLNESEQERILQLNNIL